MGSSRALLFPFVIAASACTATSLPAPVIDAVVVDNTQKIIGDDVDRAFTVLGRNFSAGVTADAGNPDSSTLDPLLLSIARQGDLDAAPIFVVGTMHGSTEITGWIPPEVDALLERGVYDVTVHNADGTAKTHVGGFELGFRAESVVFTPNGQTELNGDDNQLATNLALRAADGGPGWVREPFAPSLVILSGADLNVSFTGDDQFLAFSDEALPILVTDSAIESILIQADSLPAGVTTSGALVMHFIAGPGVNVVIPPSAELNIADDFAVTEIRIEDAWGNLTENHPDYSVTFSTQTCSGAAVIPPSLTILGGTSSMGITVTCGVSTAATVFANETTVTDLPNETSTVIVFN